VTGFDYISSGRGYDADFRNALRRLSGRYATANRICSDATTDLSRSPTLNPRLIRSRAPDRSQITALQRRVPNCGIGSTQTVRTVSDEQQRRQIEPSVPACRRAATGARRPPARTPGGDVIAMTSVDGPGADLFDVLPFGAGIFNDSGGGRILSLLCSAAAGGGTDTNSTSLVRRHDRPPGPHGASRRPCSFSGGSTSPHTSKAARRRPCSFSGGTTPRHTSKAACRRPSSFPTSRFRNRGAVILL